MGTIRRRLVDFPLRIRVPWLGLRRRGTRTSTSDVPRLWGFVASAAMVLVALGGIALLRERAWWPAALLLVGAVAGWLRLNRGEAVPLSPLEGVVTPALPRWWLGGALALGAVGVAVWNWLRVDIAHPTATDWWWYVATLGLFCGAILVMESWSRPRIKLSRASVALLGIIGLAALLRFAWLGTLPFGVWYDEAANGLEALRLAREPAYRPFYTDGVNATGHYLLLLLGAIRVLGDDVVALRALSALMGVATVGAAYLAGRELHDRRLGIILAFLVAVARWSLTFSRLGMYNAATPLFEFLALGFLLRGVRRGSVLDYGLAGMSIGFGLVFYSAYQLFLPVLGLGGILIAWRAWHRRHNLLWGAAVALVGTLLVIAPVLQFAVERPEQYFARVEKTSLFAGKAPEERLPALQANTLKHLGMFHVRGDPNGRHNLPGEPMVDRLTGALLILGLAGCTWRLRHPLGAFVLLWLGFGLLGGILSLDFEAPQSLRAIGAQPAALLAASLPIVALDQQWRSGAGRYLPRVGMVILATVLLVPIGWANVHTYFVRQANNFASWNAHSTPETLTAQLINELPPNTEAYVISLFDGHPTLRYLVDDKEYRRIETNASLPLIQPNQGNMLLVLDVDRRDLYEEAKRLYPNGVFTEVTPPFPAPPSILSIFLPAEQVASIQGLTATYRQDGTVHAVRQDPMVDYSWPQDAPVSLPFEAEWQGILAVNIYGPYEFFVEAPGEARLSIGEAVIAEGDATEGIGGRVMLARGHHNIRLWAEGGSGTVRLGWQPPDGPATTLPSWALYVPPVRSSGLLGEFYANGDWAGEPVFAQIDPQLDMYFHVPVLSRPYTVVWRGKIAAPETGRYRFGLESIDESTLMIDGVQVVATEARGQLAQGDVELSVGLHDIEVRYADRTDHSHINLYWQPPSGSGIATLQLVPTEFLFPPQENYEAVDVADLAKLLRPAPATDPLLVAEAVDPAHVRVVVDGLSAPRGVAVSDGVAYVAESGGARVTAVDLTSGESQPLAFDAPGWVEPFDVAVMPNGAIVVLDPGSGLLVSYDAAAGTFETLPGQREYVERSRGLTVDGDSTVWLANTPAQRVVQLSIDGDAAREIKLPAVSGQNVDMQPVDVLVTPDEEVLVSDAVNHMLYRFGVAGYLVSGQPIPVANTLDGTHLAVNEAGEIFLTQPEVGRIAHLDSLGQLLHVWSVRTPETPDAKPVGIDVAPDGSLWVADSQGGRLLQVVPSE